MDAGAGAADMFGAEEGGPSLSMGIMQVLTAPVFRLNPNSLVNDHKERPMFDYDLTGIHSKALIKDKNKQNLSGTQGKGFLAALSFMDKDMWKHIENEDNDEDPLLPRRTRDRDKERQKWTTPSISVLPLTDGTGVSICQRSA